MRIKFWGVRGSIPCPGPQTMKYGGNTMCIEIRLSNPDRLLIVDAGSGIRELGNHLMANDLPKGPINADIFLTHTHWDHIMGFPFFTPVFIPGTKLRVYGPVNFKNDTLEDIVGGQLQYDYFPLRSDQLSADIDYQEIKADSTVDLGFDDIKITTKLLNHPILCLGYRFEYNGKVVCTAYDTEPFQNLFYLSPDDPSYDESRVKEGEEFAAELNQELMDFFSGADLLIHDAQYTAQEYYDSKEGWGHTPIEYAINSAKNAGVKNLALVHHEPLYSDKKLDELSEKYCDSVNLKGIRVFFAKEGMEIKL
ncbi:MAG: MBL fold metallo-hydrolase [Desulfobacterales bacterium]|nr:MBL fold metallo-hydrolase [Desulfobacterales bacterium]